jgi:hypothetical protein
MPVLTIANSKGGCGRTTVATSLAASAGVGFAVFDRLHRLFDAVDGAPGQGHKANPSSRPGDASAVAVVLRRADATERSGLWAARRRGIPNHMQRILNVSAPLHGTRLASPHPRRAGAPDRDRCPEPPRPVTALALVREAIETLAPVGAMRSSEAVMGQDGPDPASRGGRADPGYSGDRGGAGS